MREGRTGGREGGREGSLRASTYRKEDTTESRGGDALYHTTCFTSHAAAAETVYSVGKRKVSLSSIRRADGAEQISRECRA